MARKSKADQQREQNEKEILQNALGERQIPYPATSWRQKWKTYTRTVDIIVSFRQRYQAEPQFPKRKRERVADECIEQIRKQVGDPVEWDSGSRKWSPMDEKKWKETIKAKLRERNTDGQSQPPPPPGPSHTPFTANYKQEGRLADDPDGFTRKRMEALQECVDSARCKKHCREQFSKGKGGKSIDEIGDFTIELFLQKAGAKVYQSLKQFYPPEKKDLWLEPKELVDILGRSVGKKKGDKIMNASILIFCDKEGNAIPNLGPQVKHFDTKVQGELHDLYEMFGLMFLTPGVHKTIVYDMEDVPHAPSIREFVAKAWKDCPPPPRLVEMLEEDRSATNTLGHSAEELIRWYGGVACVDESKRGELEIAEEQFCWNLLRSGTAHCGPPRFGSSRSVIFFVVVPEGFKFETYKGDTQCSEAKLICLLSDYLTQNFKGEIPWEVSKFLLDRLVSAMENNKEHGAVDRTVTQFGPTKLDLFAETLNKITALHYFYRRQLESVGGSGTAEPRGVAPRLMNDCMQLLRAIDVRQDETPVNTVGAILSDESVFLEIKQAAAKMRALADAEIDAARTELEETRRKEDEIKKSIQDKLRALDEEWKTFLDMFIAAWKKEDINDLDTDVLRQRILDLVPDDDINLSEQFLRMRL